jgi:hypothetical protein
VGVTEGVKVIVGVLDGGGVAVGVLLGVGVSVKVDVGCTVTSGSGSTLSGVAAPQAASKPVRVTVNSKMVAVRTV